MLNADYNEIIRNIFTEPHTAILRNSVHWLLWRVGISVSVVSWQGVEISVSVVSCQGVEISVSVVGREVWRYLSL
jgi:hypothetical protein